MITATLVTGRRTGAVMVGRKAFDFDSYRRRTLGPCFVCAILAGHPDYVHEVVYEDDATIAFLAFFSPRRCSATASSRRSGTWRTG